jgi:hypothetical protein
MASISFNPDRMEFLVSFTFEDMAENKNEEETLNLGQAQILMKYFPCKRFSYGEQNIIANTTSPRKP